MTTVQQYTMQYIMSTGQQYMQYIMSTVQQYNMQYILSTVKQYNMQYIMSTVQQYTMQYIMSTVQQYNMQYIISTVQLYSMQFISSTAAYRRRVGVRVAKVQQYSNISTAHCCSRTAEQLHSSTHLHRPMESGRRDDNNTAVHQHISSPDHRWQ